MEFIYSSENNFIKKIKRLKLKKWRDIDRLFIAEGIKFLDFDILPNAVILLENVSFSEKYNYKLNNLQCKKITVPIKIFSQLTTQKNSQGILFVYNYINEKLSDYSDNIVILDKISDPGNLGTIIRLIDAVGYKDIILTNNCVDIFNEKVVRSSMGSILNINYTIMNPEKILELLKNNYYKILATNINKNSVSYEKMQLETKNAFIFGNEGDGVSDIFLENCDENIIIPIYGMAESLNVSVACGIILYKSKELQFKNNKGGSN
ncbi:MAG: RNA methyltransferase [Fusobacteriaceae bacterium]|jgi:TrmH family RNA methyltransferase|nr:RNA methyltransferase [Fusobacteriaceae bacterium]